MLEALSISSSALSQQCLSRTANRRPFDTDRQLPASLLLTISSTATQIESSSYLEFGKLSQKQFHCTRYVLQPLWIAQMFKQIAISTGRSSLNFFNMFETEDTTTKYTIFKKVVLTSSTASTVVQPSPQEN